MKIVTENVNDRQRIAVHYETRALALSLREQYPDVALIALGHDLESCRSLGGRAVVDVVSTQVAVSLELSRKALAVAGMRDEIAAKAISRYQRQCEALLDPAPPARRKHLGAFRSRQ